MRVHDCCGTSRTLALTSRSILGAIAIRSFEIVSSNLTCRYSRLRLLCEWYSPCVAMCSMPGPLIDFTASSEASWPTNSREEKGFDASLTVERAAFAHLANPLQKLSQKIIQKQNCPQQSLSIPSSWTDSFLAMQRFLDCSNDFGG